MFAGLLTLLGATLQPVGAEEPISELRIGLPQPMFKDVPKAMVNAAARPFQNMIQEKAGVKGSVEVVPDYKILAQKISAGKLDIGIFHGFEYAWIKDTPGLIPLVATVPNCGKVQACLVVHKDSKVMEPKELKGACIVVPASSKAHCYMYLEHLREKLPAGDCCPAKPAGLTPQEALVEVANDRADAALVDISSLIVLEKEAPASFGLLRVLTKSEVLPSAVVVYRKGALDDKMVARVRTGLIDCVNTGPGRLFAMFWQLKGFEDVSPAYHAHVARSLVAYPAPAEVKVPNPLPMK
jgi:ABC-type phosphate/phosphonate transport system substrate-binding protein